MPGIQGRRIMIIGGAGFIGHHLALTLARKGAEVSVIDSLQVNNLYAFQDKMPDLHNREMYLRIINQRLDLLKKNKIPLHQIDARDYDEITRIRRETDPHVIIHLAAVAHAGTANKDPYSTFDHSLRTLENALDCSRGNIEHFVYFSSSMVYGNFKSAEAVEDDELNPLGIYGALKVAGEKIVIAYGQVFDLPYTIIRPSALYGPRCVSRRVGQIFIENALNDSVLKIEGDGKEHLDFTYVDDLVKGVCLTIQKPEARNQVFNMTYGSARSIRDLTNVIKGHFPNAKVESIPRDELNPLRGTLSIEKARDLLGYAPEYPIEKGMDAYVSWYREELSPGEETP